MRALIRWLRRHPWFISTTLAFAAILFTYHDGNKQDRDIRGVAESNQRTQVVAIDQFCLLAERDHREDVRQLRRTYAYLTSLRPDEKDDTINRTIVALLPRTEAEATADLAPEICDRPGYGLPEPDPVIPKRPPLHGFDPPPGPRPPAGEPGREASSGRLPGETSRPTPRPDSPRRPAQRPDVQPDEPLGPKLPNPGESGNFGAPPAASAPPQRLTEAPRPADPGAPPPRVCVTVAPVAQVCAP